MEYIQSVSVSERKGAPKSWGTSILDAFSRIRFQLFGGLVFAVGLPAFARLRLEQYADAAVSYEHSLIGTVCALLLGYLVFRKMTVLPGARAIVNVVPAFLTSYAIIVAFFFMMRVDYSRYQFLMSFALTCVWFMLILYIAARFKRPTFCILPGTRTARLRNYDGIRWKLVKSKRFIDRYPHLPIVADFQDGSLTAEWQRIIAEEAINGRRILSASQLAESLTGRVEIESLSANAFGHLSPDSLYSPTKRYVDVASAIILLAVLWPVMVSTAFIVRLESKGPAIFKQKRVGFGGKSFTVYKFRSMRVAEQRAMSVQYDKTQHGDERITRFGSVIRKTRIDELPQVINVLKGDMSWIGPRPETLRLSEWYESEIPFYRYRHIVRPGISGWAQVKQGHVTEVEDIRRKLEYDMYYVKHFSIWLDLLIAVKSVAVVFTGKGAK